MQMNEAVSKRVAELLIQHNMTQYQLSSKSGNPKSTISNIMKCSYDSVKLRIIHEICQGFQISITDFFSSSLFDEDNLDP